MGEQETWSVEGSTLVFHQLPERSDEAALDAYRDCLAEMLSGAPGTLVLDFQNAEGLTSHVVTLTMMAVAQCRRAGVEGNIRVDAARHRPLLCAGVQRHAEIRIGA